MATDAPPPVPVLTDGPVTLRALGPEHVQGCLEQCVDPVSVRWTTVPTPYTLADAADFCLSIAPGAWADGSQWILAVEVEGRYAGNLALRPLPYDRAELAYGAHPWVRGLGHMETACRLMLEWGFAEQGLRSVLWMANAGNWASRKLAWRLGFAIEGRARRWLPQRGEYVDGWLGTLHHDDPRVPSNWWLTPPVLEGAGIRLRPFAERDVPRVVEASSDERSRAWLPDLVSPYTEEAARARMEKAIEAQATGTGTRWAVVDPGDDRLLGSISLFNLGGHQATIGYWAHPDARGRGVMTAAARRVVRWSFEDLGLRRVRAGAAAGNVASQHVLAAAGLVRTGVAPGAAVVQGGWDDEVSYAVLASEWTG